MGQPALLQKPDGTKALEATDQEILNNFPDHKRAMMRDLLKMKKPEFCGACHKSQIPQELNDYKFQRAFALLHTRFNAVSDKFPKGGIFSPFTRKLTL